MHTISGRTCSLCRERCPGAERPTEHQTCAAGQQSPPPLAKAGASGAYQSELHDLVQLLKDEEEFPAATILGKRLAEAMYKLDIAQKPMLVVPVPLHALKRRQWGFTHSEMIARVARNNYGSTNQASRNLSVRKRATTSECTRVLRNAHGKNLWLATVARTLQQGDAMLSQVS